MTNRTLKAWTAPAVHSVEQMKNATSGNGTGFAKGPDAAEFAFNGPGS